MKNDKVKGKFHGLIRSVRANRIKSFKSSKAPKPPAASDKAAGKAMDDEGAADLPALEAMLGGGDDAEAKKKSGFKKGC